MRACESCGRWFPGVSGAETQVCAHCGHEMPTQALPATAASAPTAPDARVAPGTAAGHAFTFYLRNLPRLLFLWIPALVVDTAGGLLLLRALGDVAPEELAPAQALPLLGVTLPAYAASLFVKAFLWGIVAHAVVSRLPNVPRPPPLRERLGALAGMALLISLGVLAFFFVLALIGGIALTTSPLVSLLGLALVVLAVVAFHWYVYVPAAVGVGGASAGEAFAKSRRFAREQRTLGFTALLVLVALPVSLVPALLAAQVASSPVAETVATAVFGWLLEPVLAVLPAVYFAEASAASFAPAPPAPAAGAATTPAERFRTTKCPQCGTLVPYTATGEPVDVTCPVCGRSGRVL